MIAYHVDRSNDLKTGAIISLDYDFKPNNDLGIELIKNLNLSGVSFHGKHYLNDIAYFSCNPATFADLEKSTSTCSTSITEYTYELFRQLNYPNRPSRFSSFFALQTLEDLKYWPELLKDAFSIFEIEVDYIPVRLDANYLSSGLAFAYDNDFEFHQGFSPSMNFYFANQYWSGGTQSLPKARIITHIAFNNREEGHNLKLCIGISPGDNVYFFTSPFDIPSFETVPAFSSRRLAILFSASL